MKKQLHLLLCMYFFYPLLGEQNAPLLQNNCFNNATLILTHTGIDGTIQTRILTPADPGIRMEGPKVAQYIRGDEIRFNKNMCVGIGIGMLSFGLFMLLVKHFFINNEPKKN